MVIFKPQFFVKKLVLYNIVFTCLLQQLKAQITETADSVQINTYQFINETKYKQQAKRFGFETKSDHQFFKISVNDKIHHPLFPPKLVSPSAFQFMNFGSYDSAIVKTSPLSALNWIELQPKNNFRVKTFSDLFVLSLISSATLAAIGEEHVGYVFLNSCVGGMYAFPLLALGGIFSNAAPDKIKYVNQDYFHNLSKWRLEIGLSFGNWPLIKCKNCSYPDRGTTKGLYFNLKRRYSPFSLTFRLYHLPLPNIQQLYWRDIEPASYSNNYELHFNPALKTSVYSNNRFNLNILTGFLTQMRFLSKGSFYPYDDDLLLRGVLETELQYHIYKNFSVNFSAASHYNFEYARFPFYAGLMYAKSRSYESGLNLNKINVMPFVHFININLDAEGHSSFLGNQNEKMIFKPIYGLGLSMNISRLTELSYLLSVDLEKNISAAHTKVSHSVKFTGYLPVLDQLLIGVSGAISIGQIYGFPFEFIPGFNMQYNFMKNLAVFGSFEKGIISENYTPSFCGIGIKLH